MKATGALLLAALGACGGMAADAGGDVRLTAGPTPATAGDTIEILLENASDEPVGYNLCTSSLERDAAGSWTPVPADRVCTMELRTLAPGGTDRFPLPLAADLPAGEYRVVTSIEMLDGGDRRSLATEPFRIR